MPEKTPFDNENRGVMFLHCALCLPEVKGSGESPKTYARLSVAYTPQGLQVWCVRHNANVLHVDFEGHQHPGILSRKI